MQFETTARRVRAKAEMAHRHNAGYACAMCKDSARDLAFNAIAKSYHKNAVFDKGFVPLSAPMDRIEGCFPVCTQCAPPCPTCGLPVATKRVRAFAVGKGAGLGAGVCPRHGLKEFLAALPARLFLRSGRA